MAEQSRKCQEDYIGSRALGINPPRFSYGFTEKKGAKGE
jgi:hypothetical protein